MKINPVLYLEAKSSVTDTIAKLLAERRKRKATNLTGLQKDSILRIKCFTKNYSGLLKRNGITNPDYIFYNEREWRLVPERDEIDGAPFSVSLSNYKVDKNKYNNRIAHLRYHFDISYISYIIVEKTAEIPQLIENLRLLHEKKYDQKKLDLLMSKICSSEQIIKDY